ncbi:hypothetical protein [Zunongwangia sp. HRR-M8]|uniref:hypothetical protein n=1 Tax=Zunongwangia sp. HRR-M8 TaxID=3015170 RepID=UPI0022DD348B|nr:hypothetical protein [Zunongwangia sp. HRR-M8]WBL22697.1 hypothetical protein PBT89_01760 [Zunongwangia sp. HRR-M8]
MTVHLEISKKGILIPRLTQSQRDSIKPSQSENSLLIFNISEGCYNFWDSNNTQWRSLCGDALYSEATLDCSEITIEGTFFERKDLSPNEYLTASVDVKKVGKYSITANTSNGYGFYAEGRFLNTGIQRIRLEGQGRPENVQKDEVSITASGIDINCNNPVSIDVEALGTFSINCSGAEVLGSYHVGVPLNYKNQIKLQVEVTAPGYYNITTKSVNGISFKGSGTFDTSGNQDIILQGSGTPSSTSSTDINITDQSDSSCKVSIPVNIVNTKKRLLSIGNDKDGYGYNFSGNAASNSLITSPINYGDLANSTVDFNGWSEIIDGTNAPGAVNLKQWTTGKNPVDIIIIGFSWNPSEEEASILIDYLNNNGVVLLFSEATTGLEILFKKLFNSDDIKTGYSHPAGALYEFSSNNDDILNGPFGDIRQKAWGEDASSTNFVTGIPSSAITVYSHNTDISQANPDIELDKITAFRHNSLNLIFVGDGGFNSNGSNTSDTVTPFMLDANNFPVFKPSYGRGPDSRDKDVYNSVFTANAIAWAIKMANSYGINSN